MTPAMPSQHGQVYNGVADLGVSATRLPTLPKTAKSSSNPSTSFPKQRIPEPRSTILKCALSRSEFSRSQMTISLMPACWRRSQTAFTNSGRVQFPLPARQLTFSPTTSPGRTTLRHVLEEAKKRNVKFLLPIDHVVAIKPETNAVVQQIGEGQPIPADRMALDIGPKTIELFSEEISRARTIVWNGPMGVFEVPGFSRGTFKVAHAVAENVGAISIVGGGDTVAAVHGAEVADKITHISTGGGASLEFLEGKKLPGVEALTDKK